LIAALRVTTLAASILDVALSGIKALASDLQSAVSFPVVVHLAVDIFFSSAVTSPEDVLAAASALTRAALSSAKVGLAAALVAAAFFLAAAAAAAAFLSAAF
jgi:hypothetical protein